MHFSSMTNPVYESSVSSRAWTDLTFGWRGFFSPMVGSFILKYESIQWSNFVLGMKDWHQIWRLFDCERSRHEDGKPSWGYYTSQRRILHNRKDQHNKQSVGSSSGAGGLGVDLLRRTGVRVTGLGLAGVLSVEPRGQAGTSVKNDCKSVSSPVNCFRGDFLNT